MYNIIDKTHVVLYYLSILNNNTKTNRMVNWSIINVDNLIYLYYPKKNKLILHAKLNLTKTQIKKDHPGFIIYLE